MPKRIRPKIFIASSSEGLDAAKALQVMLRSNTEAILWTDNIFRLSRYTYESLRHALDNVHYCVLVLTADDMIKSRGTETFAPRDNLLFEAGLAAGRLGLSRTFIVVPRDVDLKMPSDLLGVGIGQYDTPNDGNWMTAMSSIATLIEIQIRESGGMHADLSWEGVTRGIIALKQMLLQAPNLGGFGPDILLGISRGGIIVADQLGRALGGRIPVLSIWADRYLSAPDVVYDVQSVPPNRGLASILSESHFKNILLVDDILISGTTLARAKEFVSEHSQGSAITLRTAVLVTNMKAVDQPDYFALTGSGPGFRTPFSDVI